MAADSSVEPVVGESRVALIIDNKKKWVTVRLIENFNCDCVLGIDFLKAFEVEVDFGQHTYQIGNESPHKFHTNDKSADSYIVGECAGLVEISQTERSKIDELVKRLVKEPEKIHRAISLTEHVIDVGDHPPIKQNIRRYSPAMLKVAHEAIDKLLKEGIIERAPSPWCSPPVIVRKQDGTFRFCVDYRKINAVTKAHAHPIPNIDSILDRLRNAVYISKIDMSQAFHQVPMAEKSKDITAFAVEKEGQFRFVRMPFGLRNSPPTYQAAMDKFIAQEIPPDIAQHVFNYIDDFVIVTDTFERHLEVLEIVLQAMARVNLQINLEKSQFCCSSCKYLGYIIDKDGLQVDKERVKAIDEYPAPTNLTQLRRFLGMVGWFSRFLEDFSKDKVPLCHLMKNDVAWHWKDEQENAFQKIKSDLKTAPILIRPNFEERFYLHTDASNYAIGAILTQIVDGRHRPIVFLNRLLKSSERKWHTTEKECQAVVWAIDKLRPYLEGYPFTVYTDHSSLKGLKNMKDPTGRLGRWAMKLLAYDITIVHREGAANHAPDALSRAWENQVTSIQEIETDDEWYVSQMRKVSAQPNRYVDWQIVDGKLYFHRPHSWIDPLVTDLNSWKLVVPYNYQDEVLREAHDNPQSGHFGREKTLDNLARLYYWRGMQVDAARFVSSCEVCQSHKPLQSGPHGIMPEHEYDQPWSEICADIMGPFPLSKNRNQYVLVVQDTFTKYVVCKALKQANGPQIAKVLEEEVFKTFGLPKVAKTDNGSEFENNYLNKFLNERGILHTTIPPYHPQANPAERVNRTLKRMIRSYLQDNHKLWDEHLPEFEFAINNSTHESTKYSPFFLNFGREPRMGNQLIDSVGGRVVSSKALAWEDRITRLSAFHDLVKKYLSEASIRQAEYYNRGRIEIDFKVGDLVMKREHYLSKGSANFAAKLAPPFSGPYKISKRISASVYELEQPSSRRLTKVHVRFLKKFVPNE